jgi:hypothetical protein
MLFAIAALLFVIWILALVTHFVVSTAIHLVLAAAVVMFIVGLVAGRRTIAH